MAQDRGFEGIDERPGTFAEPHRLLGIIKLVVDLEVDARLGAADLVPPVKRLDHLLRAKRDQHADDDDPDLAKKLAPAVQRFGKVEMHVGGPPARRG